MKIIKDERLKLKNLHNVRIAYLIQTTGIIGILLYDLITKGLEGMTANPLWFVLVITTVVFLYLNMSITVDNEGGTKSAKKGRNISIIVLFVITIVIGFFISISDGFNILDGMIIGAIMFSCGIIPIMYIYFLRKKRMRIQIGK